MSNKNDHDTYIIPPNFIETGTFFGGMFRARNVIEAGILVFAIGAPVFLFLPFGLTTRIIILCLTALPVGLVALIGISGESLSQFLVIFLKYLRNRRVVGGDGEQPEDKAAPSKSAGKHLKQRPPKEKKPKAPKRRRSGEADFPAEFDEVRSYEIREKLRPKKNAKKERPAKANKAKKKAKKRPEKGRLPKRPAHVKEQKPACLNPVADYLPIEKVENGIIYTKDHRFVKVVEVVPINFMLRSAREQRNIIYSFVSYLKISPVKLQIKVLTRRADINRHLDTVRREMAHEENEQCRLMQEDYLNFVQQVGSREAVTRRFFLIFEYEPWANTRRSEQEDEAIQSLQSAVHTASNYLRQCGNEVIVPENEDEFTVDVLYMAVPSDGGDLNELLASMDQTDEDAAPTEDGGTLPELTESEMFGAADADTAAADALPGEDDTAALTEGPDSDDGEDASAVPADEGAADVPGEPISEEAEEPEPPKPKRTTRRKKTAPAESTAPVEEITAEAEPPEPMAPVEEDAPSDDSEAAAAETPASLAEPPAEAAPAPASTPRRTAAPRRSEPSILTIRSREDVETQEDREDIIWHEIHNAYRTRRILTGKLGGIEQLDNRKTVAVVDYKGFRIIIPLKEMMINLGRSPSGQEYADLMLRQNKILGNMLGADIDFVVRGIDSKTRSVVASRREAMMRKRQTFYFDLDPDGMYRVYEGRIVQARVIAVAEKVVRVEVFGVECSILARDLAWDWIGDAHERFAVGDEVLVRILSVRRNSLEDLGIRADIKSTSENTDRDNLQKCRIQGKYAGKVTDVHKGVVYVRLANGVNAVAHSCYDYRMPGKKDDVSFAVTRLDMERGVAVGIITRIIRQNL